MARQRQVVPDKKINSFCLVFPEPSPDEYSELKASIKKQGQLYPIQLDAGGQILDGRSRFRACQELYIKPSFKKWEGRGGDELYAEYVVAVNARRRHLSKTQIAACVAKAIENIGKSCPTVGQSPSCPTVGQENPNKNKETLRAAAEKAGISKSLVGRATRITEKRPDLASAMTQGKVGIREAERLTAKSEPVMDLFGNKIPAEAAASFREGGELAKIKRQIDSIRREIDAMADRGDPLTTYLAVDSCRSALKQAALCLSSAAPFCLCPKCSGDKCNACHKVGWVNEETYGWQIKAHPELKWPGDKS